MFTRLKDPYWKKVAAFSVLFVVGFLLIRANSELASFLVDQDISTYVKETGSFPSQPETYEAVREKSQKLRMISSVALVIILNFLFLLVTRHIKANEET